MKKKQKKLYVQQKKRYLKKIVGSLVKPRLSVFRSHKHIYAQLIDDKNGHTLAATSTLDPQILKSLENITQQEASFIVGKHLAEKATLKNISFVVFDRGIRPYHGRIKQIAEGAREAGLVF
jgi:large subunit ribosomal protein L18